MPTKLVQDIAISHVSFTSAEFEAKFKDVEKLIKGRQGKHLSNGFYITLNKKINEMLGYDAVLYSANDPMANRLLTEEFDLNTLIIYIKPIGGISIPQVQIMEICKFLSEALPDAGLFRAGQSSKYVGGRLANKSKGLSGQPHGMPGILYPLTKFRVFFK